MFPTLSATDTMKNTYYGECKAYATPKSLWEILYDQGVRDTGFHKQKYHWADVYWIIKIKVKGDNIATMYNMLPCKFKVIYVEDDIKNLSPIIQNRNAYPRE